MQAQIGRSPNYATSVSAQSFYKLWNGTQYLIHIGLCIVCVKRQPERAQSLIDIKAILASEEEIQNRSKDGTELAQIEQCLPDNGIANADQLRKMYLF